MQRACSPASPRRSGSAAPLAASALRAVHAAEPYPMLEVAARCLNGVTIIGRFRNPKSEEE
jgi:hypothetical protein